MSLRTRTIAAFAAIAALAASPATAQQSVADFYKGKTVALLLGTGPGGSYDLYARIFAEHLSRHIPGNPSIVIEHMPGAGGVNAGNHLFGPGPQDGTKILLSHAIIMAEVLTPKAGVRFQSAKFNWIGTYDAIAHTMAFWHEAPVKTVADLKKVNIIVGSFAKSHFTYQWPAMMKDVLGLDFKLITGYPTGSTNNLAMERGEIHGWAASWENLIGTRPQWIKEKKVTLLMQFLLERKHQIPDVPTLLELAPPDKKDIVEFMSAVDAVRPRRGGRTRRAGRARRRAARRFRSDHQGPGVRRDGAEAAGRHRLARPRAHHVAGQEDRRRLAGLDRAGEAVDRTRGVGPGRYRSEDGAGHAGYRARVGARRFCRSWVAQPLTRKPRPTSTRARPSRS